MAAWPELPEANKGRHRGDGEGGFRRSPLSLIVKAVPRGGDRRELGAGALPGEDSLAEESKFDSEHEGNSHYAYGETAGLWNRTDGCGQEAVRGASDAVDIVVVIANYLAGVVDSGNGSPMRPGYVDSCEDTADIQEAVDTITATIITYNLTGIIDSIGICIARTGYINGGEDAANIQEAVNTFGASIVVVVAHNRTCVIDAPSGGQTGF